MTVFSKILKAGEGKRVRQLAELVPPINELADEVRARRGWDLSCLRDIGNGGEPVVPAAS